jgi:hypothetical protein
MRPEHLGHSRTSTEKSLPSYFGGFRRLLGSQTLVERGQLDTGDVVENP